MPPADRTRDAEAEGAGRGAQPGAEGVEGETATQEEGSTPYFIWLYPDTWYICLEPQCVKGPSCSLTLRPTITWIQTYWDVSLADSCCSWFLWCDVHVLSLKHSSCCSAWLFSLWNNYLALLPFVATVLRHAFQMIAFCSTSEIQTTPDVAMFVPVWKDKHRVEHFPVGRNKTQWILRRQLNICMAAYSQYLQWRHFNHRSWKNSRYIDSLYRPALHVTSNNVFRKDLKVWTVRRITSVRWPHSLPEAHYTKETEAFPCVCSAGAGGGVRQEAAGTGSVLQDERRVGVP